MDLKGLLLAGAIFVVPAWANAEPLLGLHPAEPTGAAPNVPSFNAFDEVVPLLDRDAPSPSYGPAPPGGSASVASDQISEEEMPNMDHGSMNHGDMSHGTPSSSN